MGKVTCPWRAASCVLVCAGVRYNEPERREALHPLAFHAGRALRSERVEVLHFAEGSRPSDPWIPRVFLRAVGYGRPRFHFSGGGAWGGKMKFLKTTAADGASTFCAPGKHILRSRNVSNRTSRRDGGAEMRLRTAPLVSSVVIDGEGGKSRLHKALFAMDRSRTATAAGLGPTLRVNEQQLH
jgi:hypothetical protein